MNTMNARNEHRIWRVAAVMLAAVALASAQQPAGQAQRRTPPPPLPGVPGVQGPMSGLIPDAEYSLSAGSPDWLAIGPEGAWVTSKPTDEVLRMDPESNKIIASIVVKKPCSGFALGAGTLWSPSCDEHVIYRDRSEDSNKVVSKVPVGPANTEGGIAFGAGSAWMPTRPEASGFSHRSRHE